MTIAVSGAATTHFTEYNISQNRIVKSGPPVLNIAAIVSETDIAQLQLAHFLQHLEAAFFEENVPKLENWVKGENLNASVDAVRRISNVGAFPR